jgi:PAS domain-containing protein
MLHSVCENLPEAAVLLDDSLHIKAWNHVMFDLTGITSAGAKGKYLLDMFSMASEVNSIMFMKASVVTRGDRVFY